MKTINLFILEFSGIFLLGTGLFDNFNEGISLSVGILMSCVYIGIERGIKITKEADEGRYFPARTEKV